MGWDSLEVEPLEVARALLTADMVYLRTVDAVAAVVLLLRRSWHRQEEALHFLRGERLLLSLPAANQTSRVCKLSLSQARFSFALDSPLRNTA